MDGAPVESITEAEPDAPVVAAPPSAEEDAPDAGKCPENEWMSALIQGG